MATRLVFQFQPLHKKSTSRFQPLFNKIISATISDFSGRITPPPPVDAQERVHPMDPQQIVHPTAGNQFMAKGIGHTGMHLPPDPAEQIHIFCVRVGWHADLGLEAPDLYELLASVLGSKKAAKQSMLYIFRSGPCGFMARMTRTQALKFKDLQTFGAIIVTNDRGEVVEPAK